MKKILSLLLLAVIVITVTACGTADNAPDESNPMESVEDASLPETVPSNGESELSVPEENDEISPLLWKATDGEGRTIWFFGTIHAGDKRSQGVLDQLKPIIKECDALAVEFNVLAFNQDMAAQIKALSGLVYTDGTQISDHIPSDLYNNLVSVMKEAKIYNSLYDMYKPALWQQLLTQAMIKKSSLKPDNAMDSLLINDAYSAEREILEVESAEFQYALISQFSDEYYIFDMQQSLAATDQFAESLDELYKAWLNGDEQTITGLLDPESGYEDLSEAEKIYVSDYYEKMISNRNIGMAEKAKEYVSSGKTVFFAVGTAHFLGDDGIISLLKKDGFKIERVFITND